MLNIASQTYLTYHLLFRKKKKINWLPLWNQHPSNSSKQTEAPCSSPLNFSSFSFPSCLHHMAALGNTYIRITAILQLWFLQGNYFGESSMLLLNMEINIICLIFKEYCKYGSSFGMNVYVMQFKTKQYQNCSK